MALRYDRARNVAYEMPRQIERLFLADAGKQEYRRYNYIVPKKKFLSKNSSGSACTICRNPLTIGKREKKSNRSCIRSDLKSTQPTIPLMNEYCFAVSTRPMVSSS